MKVYVLNAIIDNQTMKSKFFESREKACRYLAKILDDHNLEVEEIVIEIINIIKSIFAINTILFQ